MKNFVLSAFMVLTALSCEKKSTETMQLCVYGYSVLNENKFPDNFLECGIWSFAEVNKGVQNLQLFGEKEISTQLLEMPMQSIKNVILDILDPEKNFVEEVKETWGN